MSTSLKQQFVALERALSAAPPNPSHLCILWKANMRAWLNLPEDGETTPYDHSRMQWKEMVQAGIIPRAVDLIRRTVDADDTVSLYCDSHRAV